MHARAFDANHLIPASKEVPSEEFRLAHYAAQPSGKHYDTHGMGKIVAPASTCTHACVREGPSVMGGGNALQSHSIRSARTRILCVWPKYTLECVILWRENSDSVLYIKCDKCSSVGTVIA